MNDKIMISFLGYFCISFWQMCRTTTYHLVWPRFFFRSTCCWLPGFFSLYILYSSPISARCFVGNKTKKPQSSSSLFEINLNFTSFRSLTLLAKISPPHPTWPWPHYYKMWVQFTNLCSLDQWTH
jgi:hypothetical protein